MEEKNQATRRSRAQLADRKKTLKVVSQHIEQVGVNANGKPKYRKITKLSNGNAYSTVCQKPENQSERRVVI